MFELQAVGGKYSRKVWAVGNCSGGESGDLVILPVMSAIHLAWNPVGQQLESLRVLVEELRREVGKLRAENAELRRENAELRQQVNSLKCDVGY